MLKISTLFISIIVLVTNVWLAPSLTPAQTAPSPDQVLQQLAANEEKLRTVELNYSYRQDVLVQTVGEAKSITNQLHRVSDITYNDLGNRIEKIIEFPPSALTTALGVAKPDFKSLLGVDPFFLTTEKLPMYATSFVGKEKLDELNTYVFDVEPKEDPGKKKMKRVEGEVISRPFKGRIWIDDRDLLIVKAEGRAVLAKEDKERFPKFEYYREFVGDGQWLPSFVFANDVLDFKRFDLPIKIQIKYTDYKKVQRKK